MGSVLSTGPAESGASSISANHAPLPPPRIINSSFTMPMPRLDIVPQVRDPVNVKTTRRSIPFMLDRGSLVVRELSADSVSVSFAYRSDVAIDISGRVDGDKVFKTSKSLPPCEAMTNFTLTAPLGKKMEFELFDADHSLFVGVSDVKTDSVDTMKFTWKQDGCCVDILSLYVDAVNSCSCVICFSASSTVGFLPCRHVCVCQACAKETLSSTKNHCPLCRAPVSGRIAID